MNFIFFFSVFMIVNVSMNGWSLESAYRKQIHADWKIQADLRYPEMDIDPSDPRTYANAAMLKIQNGLRLARDLQSKGVDVQQEMARLETLKQEFQALPNNIPNNDVYPFYRNARTIVRKLAFRNPLLDFDSILFVKRAPGTLPHISDQYYGWWSRPGGGIYILESYKSDHPQERCLTSDWPAGNFLRPDLSYDGQKILFAYCRHYPHVSKMEKVDKEQLPEDAFYQIYEMDIDGTKVRQLTQGRYDDFDARYLPNGEIVFLSTRKGQFIQCTKSNTQKTIMSTQPDSYVRCGGDNTRPCAVYTLHVMDADGENLRPISAFETFEYTPSVSNDGRILYTRWDYIDRFNGHFFSLWSTNPDGTNPQLVYGNYTTRPQAVSETRSIPNSDKMIFTAAAHHSVEGGSLVLLDRSFGSEGEAPLTRLTPEIPFPETEAWMDMYYANPYPLSEDYFLVTWSNRRLPPHWGSKQVTGKENPVNALGLYLYDQFGNLELITRDPKISCMYPLPIHPRERPPVQPTIVDWDGPQEGSFLVSDVYQGLDGIERDRVKRIRIIGVPPKTQPHMNQPSIGVSKEDPGKFVLGTVPVEKDGSAFFRIPSGIPVFFQALGEEGMAIQTMRSLTYVQPGQTLSCIGCHESRESAPNFKPIPLAARREPSKLTPAPDGSWPLRFDQMVQPVLDQHCVSCHHPESGVEKAAAFDLKADKSYDTLMNYAEQNLEQLAFEKDRSNIGECVAQNSALWKMIRTNSSHKDVNLDESDYDRLITWMDVYAHRTGSFSKDQEQRLTNFRHSISHLFTN